MASGLGEIARVFLRLGCTSFGGPIAHTGYFRRELVETRRWVSEERFTELVALCQFLPGPASSQLVFALGMLRGGWRGACVASTCFTIPSAVAMLALAYGFARAAGVGTTPWVHGLTLAAVPVVAHAVWTMARRSCTRPVTATLALLSAGTILLSPLAATPVLTIVGGGAVGAWAMRLPRVAEAEGSALPSAHSIGSRRSGATLLAVFGALLVGLPALARAAPVRAIEAVDAFYRAGALVFGGGHVVLPLLRGELVPRGWITDDAFLAGYGAAQALPGPLFTFSAYLGASIDLGVPRAVGGFLCLFTIFLPAWLLVAGALPFWARLHASPVARRALAGANASVVGVLLAAFVRPVCREGLHGFADAGVALLAFALLLKTRLPPCGIVLACTAYSVVSAALNP